MKAATEFQFCCLLLWTSSMETLALLTILNQGFHTHTHTKRQNYKIYGVACSPTKKVCKQPSIGNITDRWLGPLLYKIDQSSFVLWYMLHISIKKEKKTTCLWKANMPTFSLLKSTKKQMLSGWSKILWLENSKESSFRSQSSVFDIAW